MTRLRLVERVVVTVAVLALGAHLGVVPLESATASVGSEPLRVSVTLPPLGWLVTEIAGDRVKVQTLVGPGDSPATFSPSDVQVTELSRSMIYFRVGVPAESSPWFRAIERMGRPEVVDLRQGVALREIEGHDHRHGAGDEHEHDHAHGEDGGSKSPDPHIWLSPIRLRIMAATIARTLSEADPASSDFYGANLDRLRSELTALEEEIRARLVGCESRVFFVFHPAWGYFADDFGLEQVPIELSGKEPSESELTALAREAREHAARVVFVQPQFRGAGAEVVAAAVGATVEQLDPLAFDVAENLRHASERMRAAICGGVSE